MKYQVLFSLKNNEKYSRLLSSAVLICALRNKIHLHIISLIVFQKQETFVMSVCLARQRNPSIKESRQRNPSIKESRQRNPSIKESRQRNPSIKESRQRNPSIKESILKGKNLFLLGAPVAQWVKP